MRRAAGPRAQRAAVQTARGQRRNMPLPEVMLFAVLKARPAALKFKRQHPLGERLSLDFYCNDARLAIEVDGEAHGRGDRPERDDRRDALLAGYGIATLRIPAVDVLKDMDAVVTRIVDHCRARLPLHHPAAPGGPPPRAKLGED